MHKEVVSYKADGLLMQSHLYFDGNAPGRPGILVFPEALGLSQHAKNQAERLAGLGFIALACDLHGEGKLFADLKSVSGASRLAIFCDCVIRLSQKRRVGPKIEDLKAPTANRSFGGTIGKKFVHLQKLWVRFVKSVRCSIQKLRNHPEPSQRKQRKEVRKEHECYRYQKGDRGNVGNH